MNLLTAKLQSGGRIRMRFEIRDQAGEAGQAYVLSVGYVPRGVPSRRFSVPPDEFPDT
jgi:hypothetical protein